MIPKVCLTLLIWTIRISGWTFTAPLSFNERTMRAKIHKSKILLTLSTLSGLTPVLTTLFTFVRVLWLIRSNGADTFMVFLHIVFLVTFLLPSLLQFIITFRLKELVTTINHSIQYFIQIEQKFGTKELQKRKSSAERLMKICLLGLAQPLLITFFILVFMFQPSNIKYLTFAMPGVNEPSLTLAIVIGVPLVAAFYRLWLVLFLMVFPLLTYTDSVLLILQEIKPKVGSILTRQTLRAPEASIQVYRCLSLLMTEFNQTTRDTLQWADYVALFLNVTCNVVFIKMFSQIGPGILVFVIPSIGCTSYLLVTSMLLARVFELSKGYTTPWKGQLGGYDQNTKMNLKKQFKSCRPMSIELGSFGYYRKPTKIRTVGKIIFYTGKLILMLKKK